MATAAIWWQPGESEADRGEIVAPPSLEETSPELIRPLAPRTAQTINAAIPLAAGANPAAEPFKPASDDEDRENALNCLTSAVFYEAAGEGHAGETAVAQVVLNRVRHPAFPSTVCGVVFQGSTRTTGCQFTFTCDGSLLRPADRRGWANARRVAHAALSGAVNRQAGLSTHYHADYVVPYWASRLAKTAVMGAHIFYRLPGRWGAPVAFRQPYAKGETDFRALRAAALMSRGAWADLTGDASSSPIRFVVDERVELLRIVDLLGRGSTTGSSYEKDVKAHFAGAAGHPAVTLLQQARANGTSLTEIMLRTASSRRSGVTVAALRPVSAASGDAPDQPDLAARLADFAASTNFSRFFREHRTNYEAEARKASKLASSGVRTWEAYTGARLADTTVLLLPGTADADCVAAHDPAGSASGSPHPSGVASPQNLLAIALAQQGLHGTARRKANRREPAPVAAEICLRYQLVRAVFERVVQLSGSGRQSRHRGRANDESLSATIADRLRYYESNRDDYPTLAAYFPRLAAGLSGQIPPKARMATASLHMASCDHQEASRRTSLRVGEIACADGMP